MKRILWSCAVVIVLAQVSLFLFPRPAHAIPAWGRKYNAPCAMCHYPNVPRLNTLGHQFRRAGYRMPDEFGKGQEINQVGNFLAGRIRPRLSFDDKSTGGTKIELQLSDATLFYSGAFSQNFSASSEIEINGQGEVELLASISGIYGKPDHFSTFRVGQMHLLSRVGFGGFDRPTGISSPSILGEKLTSSAIPFIIGEDQKAFELTHVRGRTRLIAQVLNGLDSAGSGTATGGDADKSKDVSIAFEQIFDDIASGMTLYGYFGTWHNTPTNVNEFNFQRYGITANKVFSTGFEVMGGYIRSKDNVPASIGSDASGNAFFAELEQYLRKSAFTLLARYDYVDPSTAGGDLRQKVTLGGVKTVNDNVRLALEASRLRDEKINEADYKVLAELMVNF